MNLATAIPRVWRQLVVAAGSVALLATVLIVAGTPEIVGAQQAVTCYAIADSNAPGNLNSEGQVDTLVRIENALTAPSVTVVGGNGGLGTGDAEANAIRPLPDGSFELYGWESALNLFEIDPDTATTSDGPFNIPGKVEGLTWSGTNDDIPTNDLLWASYGNPANQVAAYTTTGLLNFGPFTTESGDLDSIVDLAWDPSSGNLFGIITDDSDDTDLIQISLADGAATFVGDTAVDMEGLGFAPNGQLVGSTGNDGENSFHLIDKNNGAAPVQSNLSAITGAFDFESVDCFDAGPPPPPLPPLSSICYAISDSQSAAVSDAGSPDTLVRINTSVPSAAIVGQIDGGNTISVEAFAIRPTENGPDLYVFDPDTSGGRLFIIDEADGSITQTIATGLSALGDVDGMTFSGIDNGDPGDDVLWMSIRNAGPPNDQIVSVDPSTGAILTGPADIDASGVPGITVNDIDAIAWDPVTDTVFGTAGSGEANSLVSINPISGAVTTVGAFGVNDVEGLGFSNTGDDNGFLFATTGKEDGDTASALYLIDKTAPANPAVVVDLFADTGVTDFESVDCINELAGELPIPGLISAGVIAECTVPGEDNSGKITTIISYLSGTAPADYEVAVTGQPGQAGTISTGDPDAMIMTPATLADATYSVTVTNVTSGIILANETVELECFVPDPQMLSGNVTSECIDNAGKIIANLVYESGEGEATFTVTVSGQPPQTVVLQSPATDMVMFSGLADGDYTVTIGGNGVPLSTGLQSVSCIPDVPTVDIMLIVDGDDADNPTGPLVVVGESVTLDYKVTNTGAVPLVNVMVSDTVLGVIACPQDTLAPGEMVTCSVTVDAVEGQFSSVGQVTAVDDLSRPADGANPGNYFGGSAIINVENATNGQDADQAPGPVIAAGDPVTWTYVVTNEGNVELTNVQLDDNRVGAITCPQSTLAVNESMTCQAMGIATEGQYTNTATAVGSPPSGPAARDTDDSNYFGSVSGIDIVKTVNGAAANVEPFPSFPEDQELTFEYKVTNNGNVALTNVTVQDSVAGLIGCPQDTLAVGEMMTCTSTMAAARGNQTMTATAQGQPPTGPPVSANDSVNYLGTSTGIVLEKLTNGSTGSSIAVGDPITWTYTVLNTSNVELTGVTVFDVPEGQANCPQTSLLPNEEMTCTLTGTAGVGLYTNTATASGQPPVGAQVTDEDNSSYTGVTGSLGDFVFIDSNRDGLQSAGEPGVGGITVNLWVDTDEDGMPDNQIDSMITRPDGSYLFSGLSSTLKYIVQFDLDPAAFTTDQGGDESNDSDVVPGSNTTGQVMVPGGSSNVNVDAGLLPASLGDKVFLDGNANGLQDGTEPGIPGIVVNLWEDTTGDGLPNEERNSTVTDGQGMYLFDGLDPTKTWIVQFIGDDRPFTAMDAGPDDQDSDAGASGVTGPYDLDFDESNLTVDAGIVAEQGATIGDVVFSDANENCVADAGEGIPGATVELINADGSVVANVTTGPDGVYNFAGVAPGDYTVRVDRQSLPLGLANSCPHNNQLDTSVAAGQVVDTLDFGYAECASIGDSVFDDANSNGIRDADEFGLGGVTVQLHIADSAGGAGEFLGATTSANDGSYDFGLCLDPTDDYVIVVTGPGSGRITQANAGDDDTVDSDVDPISGTSGVIALVPGQNDTSIDVGIVRPSEPSITIDTQTNGADGAQVDAEAELTLTYTVTNDGDVNLIQVSVIDDIYGAATCPDTNLAAGAMFVCQLTVTAADTAGTYANTGSVTAVGDGMSVSDSDETSHSVRNPDIFNPAISINTLTNGGDDITVDPSASLDISYLVTNTGDVVLTGIAVSDDVYGAISCPQDTLEREGVMTCVSVQTAGASGSVANTGSVTATGDGRTVSDTDPTGHMVVVAPTPTPVPDEPTPTPVPDEPTPTPVPDEPTPTPVPDEPTPTPVPDEPTPTPVPDEPTPTPVPDAPAIEVVAETNGSDGPELQIGSTATIKYVVTNTGNVPLSGIVLTDSELGEITTCPSDELAAGESFTCEITTVVTAGLFENSASVVGTAPDGSTLADDADATGHTGVPEVEAPSVAIETRTNGIDADMTGTGPQLVFGSEVVFTYVVTNTGNVTLEAVRVVDDVYGEICLVAELAPNQTQVCSKAATVDTTGEIFHTGTVVGTPVNGAASAVAADSTNHRTLVVTITATPTPPADATPTPAAKKADPTPDPKKPEPTPAKKAVPLAVTGSESRELVVIAVSAIAAGAALVAIGRRRETN